MPCLHQVNMNSLLRKSRMVSRNFAACSNSKRFAASGGWGYAKFDADASGKLAPEGNGSGCGYECHTRAKAHDFVFTHYGPR